MFVLMSTVRDRSNKTNKKVVWNQRKTNSIMAATEKNEEKCGLESDTINSTMATTKNHETVCDSHDQIIFQHG
jgi:hypothetical protein